MEETTSTCTSDSATEIGAEHDTEQVNENVAESKVGTEEGLQQEQDEEIDSHGEETAGSAGDMTLSEIGNLDIKEAGMDQDEAIVRELEKRIEDMVDEEGLVLDQTACELGREEEGIHLDYDASLTPSPEPSLEQSSAMSPTPSPVRSLASSPICSSVHSLAPPTPPATTPIVPAVGSTTVQSKGLKKKKEAEEQPIKLRPTSYMSPDGSVCLGPSSSYFFGTLRS